MSSKSDSGRMIPQAPLEALVFLQQRRAALVKEIAIREKTGRPYDDLKGMLLRNEVAILQGFPQESLRGLIREQRPNTRPRENNVPGGAA
jgi:hypothetical protein